MADGTIVIETDLKTDKLKNKLNKLNNDIERQTGKIKELQEQYDRAISGDGNVENPAFVKMEERINKAAAALDDYYAELKEIKATTQTMLENAATPEQVQITNEIEEEQINRLNAQYAEQLATLKLLEEKAAEIPPYIERSTDEVETTRLELERAQIALERMHAEAQGVESQLNDTQPEAGAIRQNLDAASAALNKFEKRLGTIAKKVFVFSLLTAALRSVKAYMSDALSANEDYQASLAKLRATMMTAFQPILTTIIPILQALINVLNAAIGYLAKFTAWLSGSTVQAAAKAAEELYEQANATEAAGAAAEKAKKQMSGLDEMNTWQSESSGGGGGSTKISKPDFGNLESAMGELEVFISGAALAVGAILAFTGVNIPLGIGLMAIGAAGLASALSLDWGKMPRKLKDALAATLAALGGAALVVGAILTFSGANLPLGIGLMIAGAAMLGTAAALNWNKIKSTISGDTAVIMGIIGAALLVLGIILVCAGVTLPLGIALIAAGATALATPLALNWNALKDKISAAWENIKKWWNRSVAPKFTLAFWKKKFSSIADGLTSKIKDGINAAIELFNRFINWVNDKLHITWDAIKVAGKTIIPGGDFQLLKIPKIPKLAQGAVIPANHEFLAVLGDQKQGTNLEAPEELIRKIVREESGNGTYTFIAQLDGRTIFKEVIDQGKLSRRMTGKNAFALGGG